MYPRKYSLYRIWIAILALVILSACQKTQDSTEPPVDLGILPTPTVLLDEPTSANPELDNLPQAESMLPEFQDDLQELAGLPNYRLQVEINPDLESFQGHLILDYTNQEAVELDRLYLRLYPNGGASYGNGEIKVSNLVLDGRVVVPRLSQSDSVLEVPFPAPLPSGEMVNLSIDFSGRVPVDFGGDDSLYAYGIFNYSEDVLALSGWYPIAAVYDQDGWNLDPLRPVGDAVYSDTAYYSVEVTLPSGIVLVATGTEVDRQEVGQKTVLKLVSGPARDFFMAASPRFQGVSEKVDGVQVNVYTLEELSKARAFMLEVAVDSVRIFNQEFGPYPYRELDILQAPMRNAGGVEFPGIVLIEAERSLEPGNPVLATTVAHEVAHQWWYNLVGNNVIDEPWVDEALTTFSSMLYWEDVYGQSAYEDIRSDFQYRFDQASKNELKGAINDGIDFFSQPEFAKEYGAVVYMKGALFFDALRDEIGETAFYSALQNYFLEYRYKIAAGDDLLAAFETAAGKSLDEFYQEWLRR